ncbi:MFS transporter [Actinoallomurus bryophytorum]|uniref:Putative MFS family arabinose efflux permease n=2 Tax=Actinoallomurus bryophytorum TaxID=1490222 RepID=A0A543CJH6_9ACTN|nr:putative MFS family arabinose efflux permease [Actinoallomurus bryophytorum]
MDITADAPASVAPRPRLLTLPLVLVFLTNFGAMTGFYLLLSVVPLFATSIGVGGVGAGMSTGALMLSTVAAELVTPALVARYGRRPVLTTGLVLLGAPALALPGASGLTAILVVCVVRGVGFAIMVVTVGALVAELVPASRRGEGLGLSGVVATVPAVVALPLGVWLANRVGYTPVFVAGAVTTLAGVVAVLCLPRGEARQEPGRSLGVLAGLRTPALARPSVVFSATAMAAGIVTTFVPAAVGGATGDVAVLALLVQAVAATASRWWAGRYGDRHGAARLLAPAVLVAAVGMLALVLVRNPAAVMVGMVLFGAGFGAAQSASLAAMFDRVRPTGYGAVSAVWNIAYDSGYGLGSIGFGLLAVHTGYPGAFALTALATISVLPLTRGGARAGKRSFESAPSEV